MHNTDLKQYKMNARIVVKFAKPTIQGTADLSKAIVGHFKFINRHFYEVIYLFIKEISETSAFDYNNIESVTGIRFKIGEIEYYPPKGNLLINMPDSLIEQIRPIANKYFNYSTIEKEWQDDDFSIMTIDLLL
jgi:hypothetical protein